ncbi:MAG: response regulator [Candidatus Methylomirabilia bacterium]
MTREEKRETRIIRCPSCQRYYRIAAGPPAPGTRLRCSKCGKVFSLAAATADAGASAAAAGPVPSESGRGRVLVSTDGAEFLSLIGEVLTAAGFSLRQARSGEEAWAAIGSWRPHVVLLDVALPGVPAFELCDRVRADKGLHGTGLILIASVFQQTRYKRAPTSLYGADDYIEKHHIRDRLPDKVARLLPAGAASAAPAPALPVAAPSPAPAVAPAPPSAAAVSHGGIDKREQETLIREELYGSQGRERKGLERLKECLRRYARIIISDIALYNQELVEQGIREGTFSELLKKEIEEGYRLYLVRVPSSGGGEDYYHEAVRDFIAKRTGAHRDGTSRPRGKA